MLMSYGKLLCNKLLYKYNYTTTTTLYMDHRICLYDFKPHLKMFSLCPFWAVWYVLHLSRICDLICHQYEQMQMGLQPASLCINNLLYWGSVYFRGADLPEDYKWKKNLALDKQLSSLSFCFPMLEKSAWPLVVPVTPHPVYPGWGACGELWACWSSQ